MGFSIKGIINAVRNVVSQIYSKFGPILALLEQVDVTKLNDEDRADFAAAAKEWDDVAIAAGEIAGAYRTVAAGNLSVGEWKELLQKHYQFLAEAEDIVDATKNVVG